jgi:hypothetical protein
MEKLKPILQDELTLPEKVMLAGVLMHPGWEVVMKIARAGCNDETNKVIKLDVLTPNYERILPALQQLAQAAWHFSNRLFESIEYHAKYGEAETRVVELQKALGNAKAEEKVQPGINPIPGPLRRVEQSNTENKK